MKRDPSLAVAAGVGVVLAVLVFPIAGWMASVAAGAVGFYVVALVGSGYRPARAILWGVLVIGLFLFGLLASHPTAVLTPAIAAVVFFGAVLSPAFRGWWFGQNLD
jgi:hypothetical protein